MCGKAFLTVTDTTISSGGCRASFCWSSTLWFRLTRQLYKTITVLHHPKLTCFKAFEHILYSAAFTGTYPLIRIQLDAGQMFCGNRLGKIMWTCIRQYSEKHDWHVIIHHMRDVDLICIWGWSLTPWFSSSYLCLQSAHQGCDRSISAAACLRLHYESIGWVWQPARPSLPRSNPQPPFPKPLVLESKLIILPN